MDFYSKLWVYNGECIWCSLENNIPYESTMGKVDRLLNIWDYAADLKSEGWEVFQVVEPNSEKNIELFLKRT